MVIVIMPPKSLYYLIDTDELVSYSGTDYRGEKHWWLQHGETVYDCTAEQYWEVHENPPYETGKKTKWYGWKGKLQQVSLDLMVRVLGTRLKKDSVRHLTRQSLGLMYIGSMLVRGRAIVSNPTHKLTTVHRSSNILKKIAQYFIPQFQMQSNQNFLVPLKERITLMDLCEIICSKSSEHLMHLVNSNALSHGNQKIGKVLSRS